jgi:hypothetical protein
MEDYIFLTTIKEPMEMKVSRKTGLIWTAHHGGELFGDLLDLFEVVANIFDKRKCWQKLDKIRIRLEQKDPDILAEKEEVRKRRRQQEEERYLAEIKEDIWYFVEKEGRMSPPPVGNKRAKKTARAFWEWIYQENTSLPAPLTADHLKAAFEHWERTGSDRYFRVSKAEYSKVTNWTLTKTELSPEMKLLHEKIQAHAEREKAQADQMKQSFDSSESISKRLLRAAKLDAAKEQATG